MRLASFNIWNGRAPEDAGEGEGRPGQGRVDLDGYVASIRELDADVLALQEVDRDQPRSGGADLTALAAEVMGALDSRFVAALAGTPGATWMAATGDEQPGSAAYGVALLSRYPVRQWQVVRMSPIPFRFPMWLPGPRKVIVVHEEPRVAVVGCVDTPAGAVTVASTHLSFVPGWNRRQLRGLRRDLAPFPDPLVLMGDLNMVPEAATAATGYRPLGTAATFPADDPARQLDHVLLRAPGPLPRTRVSAPRLPVSDHRGLVVDVDPETLCAAGTGAPER